MTWYYVVAIVVSILIGATGIVTALIKGVWTLSSIFGDLKSNVGELRIGQAETQKDVSALTVKIENIQLTQSSLQARTIRLEEKVDKLGH